MGESKHLVLHFSFKKASFIEFQGLRDEKHITSLFLLEAHLLRLDALLKLNFQ